MASFSSTEKEKTIKKYSSLVYKIAYSITSNSADSDDVFQNVFLRYINRNPSFVDEEHEKAWFIRVTVNCAKSFVTQAWHRKTDALNDDIEYNQPEIIDLDFALKRLKPKNRVIVYLYYYEGYSTKEIADILKLRDNAVRTSLSRSRKLLKDILQKEGYDA